MSNNKLFVGNLSFRITKNDLQDAFAVHGAVQEVNLMIDRATGRSRGYGFVTMSTSEAAQAAIDALNGKSIVGRALTVNAARPREERSRVGVANTAPRALENNQTANQTVRKMDASIKMSEHHENTEFLKHCLRYDDSPKRHAMTETLTRLQCELSIVKRASGLMGVLIAFAGASLACPRSLVPDFPYHVQRFIMNIVLGLFAGSWICLFTFIILGIFLYKKLHRQRDVCRQFLMRLFAARFDSAQQ